MLKRRLRYSFYLLVLALTACSTIEPPVGVQPVQHFQAERYMGKWYEIARLDHRFEKGLEQVSADYNVNSDGSITVINKGLKTETGQWKEKKGKAFFTQDKNIASLKVSFFWPFYGGYHVIKLDQNYQYALVTGNNKDFLWLLARKPKLDEVAKEELIDYAKRQGFSVEKLIWVKQ
ncbi:lipocalin family protein [Neisseria sp. Ec49-e6-T10]|uniref:lipocalin family protein n=1 Tax=Neisseria sp. Ec49-e6-T10 TaxID=3140744 RepID=UPI003EBC80A4